MLGPVAGPARYGRAEPKGVCCQGVVSGSDGSGSSCPETDRRLWRSAPDVLARGVPTDVPTIETAANQGLNALITFHRIAKRKTALRTRSLRGIAGPIRLDPSADSYRKPCKPG